MGDTSPPILRPKPRRPFELSRISSDGQSPPTPISEAPERSPELDSSFSRTRSVLNLTSSTLFGIYSPTADESARESEPPTPWGTGAETPARAESFQDIRLPSPNDVVARARPKLARVASHQQQRHGFKGYVLPSVGRVLALFAFGVLYGVLISQLHDNRAIAPVRVAGLDHKTWGYLAFWGVAGICLGSLLPLVDGWLEGPSEGRTVTQKSAPEGEVAWTRMIRSIGAFGGIAFAIRKLPWRSTLQVSVTLALVNPVLWYLLDRSRPGFLLSTAAGVAGTTVLLLLNPEWVPSPASSTSLYTAGSAFNGSHVPSSQGSQNADLLGGLISYESIGVATWIASVFFCSSICFGNIGRRLAPTEPNRSD